MQYTLTFRRFLSRNFFLLVLAAGLMIIAFIINNYWSANASLTTVEKELSRYIHENEDEFNILVKDTAQLNKIRRGTFSEAFLQNLVKKKFFVFFYAVDSTSREDLVCWNTQQVMPYPSLLYGKRNKGFVKLQNGFYVWNRFNNGVLKAIALIPVKWDFVVENNYLFNDFVADPSFSLSYDLSPNQTAGIVIRSVDNSILFRVYKKSLMSGYTNNPVAVFLQLVAAFFVLLFIHLYASFMAATNPVWKALLLLLATFIIIRSAGHFLNIPLNFRAFGLFDPDLYSAGVWMNSLGDVLINALFSVWFILFLRYYLNKKNFRFFLKNQQNKWILLASGVAVIIAATYYSSYTLRSLVANSKISFDVINFFTLNIYSITGFVVISCIAISYYFLSQVILDIIKPFFPGSFSQLYFVTAVGGLVMLSFRVGKLSGGFEIYLLLWLLLFLFLLNKEKFRLASKFVSSTLVFWLFFFSVSITAIIVVENRNKERGSRLQYAEMLSAKSDPAAETLVNTMLTPFREDFLADNFYRFYNQNANLFLKDSLVNENIAGYTNKYQTKIFTFSPGEKPLFNSDSTSYNDINVILNTQSKPTGIAGLFYYDKAYDMFSYISKKTLRNSDSVLTGYIFILASPKKQKAEALYPELFSKGQNNSIENSSFYSFATYKNGRLTASHNDYAFPSIISKRKYTAQTAFVHRKNHNELWYYAGADKVVVIARENNLAIESITLFSYIFCCFLLLTALLWFINILIQSRFNRNKLRVYWQLSIRNQIHGIIIFVSVISFLVIGFATILFFISRYENNNREMLSRTISIMQNEIKNSIANDRDFNNAEQRAKTVQKFGELIDRISEVHGIDVNLYDLDGNLLVSSLPLPYTKGIVSTKMHPLAYYHLNNLKEVQYFQKESIGKLKFVSDYVAVADGNGNGYAYLNIPYFTSQTNLKQEISNFLVSIINLNAFIFLLAGIVALFITNRITNSFSVISDKMKRINLGARNEVIEWKRDDELGDLINEYNKMVSKLEESARVLAKTEREGAWREMARQIAHEIKNPLTPMKLSMQYLQKAIDNNAPNVKELTAGVANTLVEQIDHLSHIAGEFSQFATIEDAKKEPVYINEVLVNVLQLYLTNDRLQITYKLLTGPVMINADKTHINRLFTNLILNAIQSVQENSLVKIAITEDIKDGNLFIKITDNGEGIDEAIRSKIFMPNFTTKTSGTGLGLAMCKRMVEQADGKIWFETLPGEGTSFFIQFPLGH